jgi:hypothetical protein
LCRQPPVVATGRVRLPRWPSRWCRRRRRVAPRSRQGSAPGRRSRPVVDLLGVESPAVQVPRDGGAVDAVAGGQPVDSRPVAVPVDQCRHIRGPPPAGHRPGLLHQPQDTGGLTGDGGQVPLGIWASRMRRGVPSGMPCPLNLVRVVVVVAVLLVVMVGTTARAATRALFPIASTRIQGMQQEGRRCLPRPPPPRRPRCPVDPWTPPTSPPRRRPPPPRLMGVARRVGRSRPRDRRSRTVCRCRTQSPT